MDKWQPIETAPRGEEIICYWVNGEMQIGQIFDGEWQNDWIPKSGEWLMPTHWIPLPAPPEEDDG